MRPLSLRLALPFAAFAAFALRGPLALAPSIAHADAPPLLEQSLVRPNSLWGWAETVGATQGGDGPKSQVAIDQRAVRLSGDASTRTWTALTRTVKVAGARWVRLSGRVRTEKVTPAGRFYACNLYVKHGGGLVPTRVVTGTTGWTPLRRLIELPAGTTQVTVGIFLAMPGRAWFDHVKLEAVPAPAWAETVHGHYRYRVLPGDGITQASLRFNEESFQKVSQFLGVSRPPGGAELVTYWKYPDLASQEEHTAFVGNAHREGDSIHSIWPQDRHEIVHVLAAAWGDPPALLGEGLAVYLSGAWQGQPVRVAARQLAAQGRWVEPAAILGSAGFRAQPDLITYAVSGAFVEWVLTVHGKDRLRALYGGLKNRASLAENRQVLEQQLGQSLDQIGVALKAWVLAR
jgi:hypothetical protein